MFDFCIRYMYKSGSWSNTLKFLKRSRIYSLYMYVPNLHYLLCMWLWGCVCVYVCVVCYFCRCPKCIIFG